jgi:hypothetical protein
MFSLAVVLTDLTFSDNRHSVTYPVIAHWLLKVSGSRRLKHDGCKYVKLKVYLDYICTIYGCEMYSLCLSDDHNTSCSRMFKMAVESCVRK